MNADYPAAHSMDTTWFAVDGAGQVAVFMTGETGHLPRGVDNDVASDIVPDEYPSNEEVAEQQGLFLFDYEDQYNDEEPIDLYQRHYVPAVPLHLYQLPASIRARIRKANYPGVKFDEAAVFQPLEYGPCDTSGSHVTFLASDGVTEIPIPPGYAS